MIEATWELIVFIIGIALVFDFTNGFHDSANSISTVVSTKVLSPRNAVAFAAFFNFIAAFAFGVAVASTVSKIIEAFWAAVQKGLKKGEEVKFTGFGKFVVRSRAAHAGRNPATGQKIKVKATKFVRFVAGRKLVTAVKKAK